MILHHRLQALYSETGSIDFDKYTSNEDGRKKFVDLLMLWISDPDDGGSPNQKYRDNLAQFNYTAVLRKVPAKIIYRGINIKKPEYTKLEKK